MRTPLLALCAGLASGACSAPDTPVGLPCATASQCPPGQSCVAFECHLDSANTAACGAEAPCPFDQTCLVGECHAGRPAIIHYSFDDIGSDKVVRDVSGIGDAVDLTPDDPSAVSSSDGRALTVDRETLILSAEPPRKLTDACRSGSLSIAVWVTTHGLPHSAGGRLVTMSAGTGSRNFSLILGPVGGGVLSLQGRLLTTGVPAGDGFLAIENEILPSPGERLAHFVFVRDGVSETASLWADGVVVAERAMTGSFDNWRPSMHLGLANEMTYAADPEDSRVWLGMYHDVAIYCYPLSPQQIARAFAHGPESATAARSPSGL